MPESFIPSPAPLNEDGTKFQSFENTRGGELVHAEATVVVDEAGDPIAVATEASLLTRATEATVAAIEAILQSILDAMTDGSQVVLVANFPASQNVNDGGGSLTVDGAVAITNFPATQPISAVALPLPAGAATEATLAAIKAKTDNIDVALSTRAVTGLTDTELRAAAVPVSGPLTDTELRASAVPVSATQLPAALVGGRLDVVVGAALPAGENNIGDVDVLSVPADPFGVNADAASATGSISAKLRNIAAVQLPAALVGGRLDENVGAWLGSTAPTVGQKTMANSLPVSIASDQSDVPVGVGNVTATGTIDADGETVSIAIAGRTSVGIVMTGTGFTGSLIFEASYDGGATYPSAGSTGRGAALVIANRTVRSGATIVAPGGATSYTTRDFTTDSATRFGNITWASGATHVRVSGFAISAGAMAIRLVATSQHPLLQPTQPLFHGVGTAAVGGGAAMVIPGAFNLDTAGGEEEWVLGANLRRGSSAGGVEIIGQTTKSGSLPVTIASDHFGQATMANSLPVAIASNQSDLDVVLKDSAGLDNINPIVTWAGTYAVVVRQSAATGAGAIVWGIYNSHASRIVHVTNILLRMFFDGTAAATLMKYELIKYTGVTAFTGGAGVTALHRRTSLAGAVVSAARVLDTGLTATSGVAQSPFRVGTQGRVTQTTTNFNQSVYQLLGIGERGTIRAMGIELAQNELLALRQVNTSVVGDNVEGYAEVMEV